MKEIDLGICLKKKGKEYQRIPKNYRKARKSI